MREPTSDAVAYDWWRRALAGEKPPIHEGEPNCGYFKRRLVKDGPYVAARIWLDAETDEDGELLADEIFRCKVGDEFKNPFDQWVWLCTKPITYEEYRSLSHRSSEAVRNEPLATPAHGIDLLKVTPPRF